MASRALCASSRGRSCAFRRSQAKGLMVGTKEVGVGVRALAGTDVGAPVQSEECNRMMKRQMKIPYEYHHELRMYYTRIDDNVIVGSQLQSKDDIEKLFLHEGVGAMLNLQQDRDVEYWGIDLQSIVRRCEELGVWYMRRPAKDFDGDSYLRKGVTPSGFGFGARGISSSDRLCPLHRRARQGACGGHRLLLLVPQYECQFLSDPDLKDLLPCLVAAAG